MSNGNIPRRNISTDAQIEWIRLENLSGNPDNANASDRVNFGIVNDVLTWVNSVGTVFTAAAGGSGVTSFNARTGAVLPAEADYTLTLLGDVTSAAQTANFILAAGDGSSGGAYRGRALVAADIPSLPASKITAGTFTAGAYIFTHATATGVPVTIDSSDNSTTNPLIRGRDSSAVVRWQIDYEGTARLGRTSGGTYNGNILLAMHDQFPSFGFRSGTTERGKLIADVNANSFILETGQLDVRATGGNPIARFGTTSAALSVGTNATSGDTTLWANLENATTNATDNVLTVSHNSSGTPAASFGGAMVMKLESSTTTFTLAARMRWQWTVATHASRTARGILSAYDTAERDCIMWEASGSATMVGFQGTAPIVKPTVSGAKGGNAALGSLLTALANYGLITDSTTA